MNLLDIITPDCVKAPLESTSKRGAIDELVDLLAEHDRIHQPEVLKEAVWTREQTRTTGIGHGLAIPHGKSEGLDQIVMAIGKPAEPMDFEAIDGQPVRLIVLLASPPDKNSDHIQALARVSRLMTLEDFRSKVYQATTGEEIWELLKAHD
ncbi:MAG: PTS sugar transporter subunit IIA [Phycisphaerales bacterium JB040]